MYRLGNQPPNKDLPSQLKYNILVILYIAKSDDIRIAVISKRPAKIIKNVLEIVPQLKGIEGDC